MADETVVNPNQPARTETGALVDQSQPATTTQTETKPEPAKSKDGLTLLSKTEPTEPAEPAKTEDGDKGKPGAPEQYADYKVADGFELVPEVKAKADALFKDLGLTQEGAQKAVDLYQDLVKEAQESPIKAYQDLGKQWADEAMNHPDLKGKLGPGKEISVRIAKMLDGLPDQALASDFRKVMDLTLAGNHPAFIRVLNHLAESRVEGTPVSGKGPSPAGQSEPGKDPPSTAAALWPNLPSSRGG